MSQEEYRHAGDSEVSWRCFHCKTINVNSFAFHAYNVSTSNSFSLLHDLGDDSVFDPSFTSVHSPGSSAFNPGLVSSPCSGSFSGGSSRQRSSVRSSRGCHVPHLHREKDNLCFLVINANSVKGKAAELAHICDYMRPDILVMSETKLDKSVCSVEFLPKDYVAVWKDCTLHGGGVMIAIRRGLTVEEIPLKGVKKSRELVFVRITLAGGAPPLFVGAYYRSQMDNSSN